ncbi:uncharacterized protein [Prorops nasuta]|uniref:uncharacterized protein n=1 Tax=Prorops nasuta TaxID=863751 RepID=UPI0034CFB428
MPVAVWDYPDMPLMDGTVVSDDIWKKFDLDVPLDAYTFDRAADDGFLADVFPEQKILAQESSEIRHHDCMWAGLCISKEHNRTLPAKQDLQVHKKVAAGRSLLISRACSSKTTCGHQHQQQQQHQHHHQQASMQQETQVTQERQKPQQPDRKIKGLANSPDGVRPETPQTSASETECEEEVPIFKHDQVCINDKLGEYMSARAFPVSEVTGQQIRTKLFEKWKQEQTPTGAKQNNLRTTLSDHCYHINQPTKKGKQLGIQTPSDSEEEIDVVTFDKPNRLALPTLASIVEQQQHQTTVKTVYKEKPAPRPRGRPPSNVTVAARRRAAAAAAAAAAAGMPAPSTSKQRQPAKRARQTPAAPRKNAGRGRTKARNPSDSEAEIERRSMHNNMERLRRIELRHSFDDLRRLIPDVECNEGAAKVTILRKASKYCDWLRRVGEHTLGKVNDLQRRQEKLRSRLSHLRRDLARSQNR